MSEPLSWLQILILTQINLQTAKNCDFIAWLVNGQIGFIITLANLICVFHFFPKSDFDSYLLFGKSVLQRENFQHNPFKKKTWSNFAVLNMKKGN